MYFVNFLKDFESQGELSVWLIICFYYFLLAFDFFQNITIEVIYTIYYTFLESDGILQHKLFQTAWRVNCKKARWIFQVLV